MARESILVPRPRRLRDEKRAMGTRMVMGLNESNHFSGLTSAFRAAYEQSNLKVGLISAFDRHTSLKVGLISAFDRHTNINRSISVDHALAHALEFGGERRNLEKVSSFSLFDNVFKLFCA